MSAASQDRFGIIAAGTSTRALVQPIEPTPVSGGPPLPGTPPADPLTGLAVRPAVEARLVRSLAQPGAGWVGVIRCGVDRFDWINDAFGLDGGDEALRRISEVLRAACPPSAVVGRIGGDEFIVGLPDLDGPEAPAAVVADLEERFRTAVSVQGQETFVTLSAGSAVIARGGPPDAAAGAVARMIREASAVMRRRKGGMSADRIGVSGVDRLRLDADLHHALGRGEIVAWFQPQYDAGSGGLTGFEALARWHHPRLGTLSPDRFIPLAEVDGLIDRLGDAVLDQACRFADLVAAGRPLRMAVNVSAGQLTGPGLAGRIARLLARHPDRAWSLTVEITESVLALDQHLALVELETLRALGVGVSIDDFGTGYSSLSRLRELPITELKIDRSFVQLDDAAGAGLLTAIVALARSLDLSVVAEGIETPSQLATVRSLGCDRLQGMHLCPPLPVERARAARSSVAASFAPAPA